MRLGKLALIPVLTLGPALVALSQTPAAPASTEVPGTNVQTIHVSSREVVVDVMVSD